MNIARSARAVLFGASIENSGSTARDHLANERTFLAWARTGVALMSAGAGLFSVYDISVVDESKSLGGGVQAGEKMKDIRLASCLLGGNGALLAGFAVANYLRNYRALIEGRFYPNKGGLLGVVALVGASTAKSMSLVVSHEANNSR
mmetsp:Transcript_17426/g.56027  ORF Transcript_17426/g.56027 Transcript_17426/m.56027 type:complete len:147 (-) Transcript_17426:104-544(-)